jgi:hypothetical protein
MRKLLEVISQKFTRANNEKVVDLQKKLLAQARLEGRAEAFSEAYNAALMAINYNWGTTYIPPKILTALSALPNKAEKKYLEKFLGDELDD